MLWRIVLVDLSTAVFEMRLPCVFLSAFVLLARGKKPCLNGLKLVTNYLFVYHPCMVALSH
jgi:hypothetical protein